MSIHALLFATCALQTRIGTTQNWCGSLWRRVTCFATERHGSQHRMWWVHYNKAVPKRLCASRAEWRLKPGKPAEPLSTNYRLDCDYGTAVITCWEDGGSEPIYVCENHAKQMGQSRERFSDVRVITPPSGLSNDPIRNAERTQVRDIADTKPNGPTSPEVVGALAGTSLITPQPDHSNDAISAPAQTQIQDIAITKPEGSTSPEVVRAVADTKIAPATTVAPARAPARDLTYGNAAKAMVDEVIWNMAAGNYQAYRTALQQGKSAAEAAQAAGGQVAVVHRKISDYTLKLEAVLSESKAIISIPEAIDKPLEQAMLEIISNGAMSDSEKDSAIQQLGALQEWIKHGLNGYMTPAQAHQIILAVGDRQNWGRPVDVSENLKTAYRALYGSLKIAIRSAVPGAQNLQERLTNLYAAKSDLETC